MSPKGTRKVCPEGHVFFKSADCPTCPTCEAEGKPASGLLSLLPGPSRRALQSKGVDTVEHLATYSEKEILALHGMGPASLPLLKTALKNANLRFLDK